MSNNRRPILYNGEVYSSPISKKPSNIPKNHPVTFEQAQTKALQDIAKTKSTLRELPKDIRLPNEVILCLRMQPEFTAKSYYPDSLFDIKTTKFGLKEIGSRIWTSPGSQIFPPHESEKMTSGKLFFVRATEESLETLEKQIQKSERSQTKSFVKDIRTISSFDLLDSSEQVLGITDQWQEGRLEAIIHPFNIDKEIALDQFLQLIESAGANLDLVKYKRYGDGVTFVSFFGNRDIIDTITGYNPLRTVHPLKMRDLPSITRGSAILPGPLPPDFKKKSPIVVGVIDGGCVDGHPYLKNYVEITDSVPGPRLDAYTSHGMQVCGTVLYGPLNKYAAKDKLPEPPVSVKSFRVLSKGTSDPDLYDVIDAIEDIVPANPEISVYNLSLGPRGPIFDDSISRFTFSCDYLSHQYNILFCVAVGNDGEIDGYDRIQAPSDMVNGLAIGAYTLVNGKIERAPYSCIGPGREGNKMKPDILAFGGSDQSPIHLLAMEPNKKLWSMGTSFASPSVAAAAGQLVGASNKTIDPVTVRALMVHSVIEKNKDGHKIDTGHGILPDDLNDMVSCVDKSYTLIYKGELEQGKYAEFTIPWIDEIKTGNVSFRWTLALSTQIDAQSPDDYTSGSIEIVFYPNKDVYNFRKGSRTKIKNINKDSDEISLLLNDGWKQATFPTTSSSPPQYNTEDELRKSDLKWDTLDTRTISKRANGISNPVFHVHSMGRGSRTESSKTKFSLILTVEATGASVDLYTKVLSKFSALVPIKVSITNTVSVKVKP